MGQKKLSLFLSPHSRISRHIVQYNRGILQIGRDCEGGDFLTSRGFVRGAMVLGVAAILSKLLGSIYTILLQNLIGDSGMGIYQMAYPIYATLLIISTAGFPVAVSKFVSEHTALGDYQGAHKIYRVSLLLLSIVGFMAMVVLYVGADFFAKISGDPRAVYAIRAISPALFIVPAMSSVRGYFQGWQMMNPTAISQVVEQLVRVLTILIGAYVVLSFGFGDSIAAAAAAFGAVSGGLAGLAVMGFFLWHYRRLAGFDQVAKPSNGQTPRLTTMSIVKRLVYYAIPVSLGALIVPLISNVDALTVTNLLKGHGMAQSLATREFGILTGRAFKLMMFPAALASAIGAALMPSVSEAFALRATRDTAARVLMGLRIIVFFSLPAAVGLFLLAKPIDITLFKDAAGYHSIQIIGIATFFSALQIALAASLQGIGAVYLPVRSLAVGTLLKIALNLALVPPFGIDGAAMATVVSYAVASILNLVSLSRLLHLRLSVNDYLLKPAIATIPMGAFVFAVSSQWQRLALHLEQRLSAAGVTVISVFIGVLVYMIMLVLLGALRENEVAAVPKVGQTLVRTFRRMGLFAR